MLPRQGLETVEACIVATPNHRFPRRVALRILPVAFIAGAAITVAAVAQSKQASPVKGTDQSKTSTDGGKWVPPGTPGSPIKGELFHAQVLLDAAGFSPGV